MGNQITLDVLKDMLPTTTSLVYVDRNESLDGHEKLIQKAIHTNKYDALYEEMSEWYPDTEWESISTYLKDLRLELESKFDLDEEAAQQIIDDNQESLQETIYERCNDDTLSDLMRNSSKLIYFYDTGYDVNGDSWGWGEKEVIAERQRIKKVLKIRGTDAYDHRIEQMILQASYGGDLVIYFRDSPDFLIGEADEVTHVRSDYRAIKFKDLEIAIINTSNGSGDNCTLDDHEVILQFVRGNVFIDKCINYNYSYDVCGMVESWCDNTVVHLIEKPIRSAGKIEPSDFVSAIERQELLTETFSNGSCTTGDMDMKRHRSVTYVNSYPCGNRCKDCGTFWVD